MKQRTIILGLLFVSVVLMVSLFTYFKQFKKAKDVHYHAGFQVYADGKLQDFSDAKFMHIMPCGEGEHKEDENLEKAHLHDGVGDVVHVHRENVFWRDLFKNLNFKIDQSKPLESYVNGKKVEDILDYPIKSYDSVVIFIGKSDKNLLKNAVTKEKIVEVEKKSEGC